ncbi:hypothetical protein, partial [Rubrivivax gelatinosus]
MRLELGAVQRVDAGTITLRGSSRTRVALRVRLTGDGVAGEGEALPLPGFSPDDADGAAAALAAVAAAG